MGNSPFFRSISSTFDRCVGHFIDGRITSLCRKDDRLWKIAGRAVFLLASSCLFRLDHGFGCLLT